MPALEIIPTFGATVRQEYEQRLPASSRLAARLPLVRVVVPAYEPRRSEEISDVLKEGRLRLVHKSGLSAGKEARLLVPSSLYFHAGRTHTDYGQAVFVLEDVPAGTRAHATPFGVGQLLCEDDPRLHPRGCLKPIAHAPEDQQRQFVASSTWEDDWRSRAAEYVAAYFVEPAQYFWDQPPKQHDPDGIFADIGNQDWRSWTLEVRALADVDLSECVRAGLMRYWALSLGLRNALEDEAFAAGRSLEEHLPAYAALPATAEVRFPAVATSDLFAVIDERVRQGLI